MNTRPKSDIRELDHRSCDGLDVTLLWRVPINQVFVAVTDVRQGTSVEIEVDRNLLLPVVIEYHEADGDSTRYEFTKMSINQEIDESRFHLELGADVKLETLDASAGVG